MPPALDFGFSQVSGESRAMTFGAVNDPTSLNPNFSDITTITLSAKTALIITGDATVQAHGKPEVWAGAELLFDTPPEAMTVSSSGGAYVSMSLGMPDFVLDANGNSMWSPNTSLARFDLLSRFDSQWDFESGPQSSPFLLSVGNPGSAAVDENFQLSLGVQTQAYVQTLDVPEVPGIPEPGTYALMGLGLMGIALARRRAQG
ncbi:MAG: PEP-CTERM sorting domain-containing protein [Rubrivivax sp.]|nr:MAG: PEP-CTERM sorting domain-containing protein [Rubrivivax sp.]